MGLIREPKNIDFYVEDRPLTDEEQHLLQAAIAKNKAAAQAKRAKTLKSPTKAKSKTRAKTKASR